MDEFAQRLRDDAAAIRADVSPELDARIRASLESANDTRAAAGQPRPKPRSTWWASSITGVVAASALIVVFNLDRPAESPESAAGPSIDPLEAVKLKTQTAIFTQPLLEELENLESDLRKTEKALREEIGLTL